MIKTYRGLLQQDTQSQIRLATTKGKVGYRIIKFELMPNAPGDESSESVVKIYKDKQSTIDGIVDFGDNRLLAAASYASESSSYADDMSVIFDQEVVNQDIYITHKEVRNDYAVNYYLELEIVNLDSNAALVTTLKDIRANA
jgi:hypothetical protein